MNRPAPPESETPETDAFAATSSYSNPLRPSEILAFAKRLERRLSLAKEYQAWYDEAMKASNEAGYAGVDAAETIRDLSRQIDLAQTEIKGHMRVVDDLKAEVERERMRVVGCSVAALGNWKEGDPLHVDYDCVAIRDVAKLRVKYDEAQARIAELEKDATRYRWLRASPYKKAVRMLDDFHPDALDAAIDAALKK